MGRGHHAEAVEAARALISSHPGHGDAWNGLGVSLGQLGRHGEACAALDRALEIDPANAASWANRGLMRHLLGRFEEALSDHDQALRLRPDFAHALKNRASTLRLLRRPDEALASCDAAIRIDPGMAEAHNNRGNVLLEQRRLPEALLSYDEALRLAPSHPEALANRGTLLRELGRHEEAAVSLREALRHRPSFEFLHGQYLHTRTRTCDWDGLEAEIGALPDKVRAGQRVIPAFSLLALVDDPALHRRAAEIQVESSCASAPRLGPLTPPEPGRCIRVGYYSADFHNHATCILIAEMLESHDRERFETYGFSFGPRADDAMRRRVSRAFTRFIDVAGHSDVEIARVESLGWWLPGSQTTCSA